MAISDYDNKCGADNLHRVGIEPHPTLDPWVHWVLWTRKGQLFNVPTPTLDEWERRCRYQSEVVDALEDQTITREAGEAILRSLNKSIRDGAFPSWPYSYPAEYEC